MDLRNSEQLLRVVFSTFGGPVIGKTILSYICKPFHSPTQASQLTRTSSFYYRFQCHYPLITYLSVEYTFIEQELKIENFDTYSIPKKNCFCFTEASKLYLRVNWDLKNLGLFWIQKKYLSMLSIYGGTLKSTSFMDFPCMI